ncbi:MAG: type I DNA topoisomerase, partial [Chloroflexi bacterium]|nr:type I DNA topoisomerase [Chloroflexota bacterium]
MSEQQNARPLVIVESPAKARTLGRFLGNGYVVRASVGHIRDLPQRILGVDVSNGFTPRYVLIPKKRDVVKALRADAREATSIYLATDPDREGEAISWHLTEALRLRKKPVYRVEFHEITEGAVKRAFAEPREINMRLVEAQQARRIMDRLVGYSLSPLLRRKMSRRGLSAGRVQSVTVRLVVEREREIQAFVPKEYWSIEAELAKLADGERPFRTTLQQIRGEAVDLGNEASAHEVVAALGQATFTVGEVRKRKAERRPAPPFTTSTLQQEASRKLGFTAGRTMRIAQQLYEGVAIGEEGEVGLITYMR